MSRSPTPALVRGARGGVSEHVVPPLLVLLPHGVVVLGVGGAHHEELLVLNLEVAVAAPLVGVSHVLYTSPHRHQGGGWRQEGGSRLGHWGQTEPHTARD